MKRPTYKDKEKKGDIDLTELATSVIKQINKLRVNPDKFTEILETDKTYFKENTLYRPGDEPLRTLNGEVSHNEAIEFLGSQDFLDELEVDDRISQACEDQLKDIIASSKIAFDGLGLSDKLEKYAEWDTILIQSLEVGLSNAVEIVISFLTDEKDMSKTTRKNLFNGNLKYIGASCALNEETGDIITLVCTVGNIRDIGTEPDFKLDISKTVNLENKKTNFQLSEPDAPYNAIDMKFVSKIKTVDDVEKNVDQKIYTISNGHLHLIEVFGEMLVK